MSRGRNAVLLKIQDETDDRLEFNIGNISPGQKISVSVEIIEQAKVIEGSYHLTLSSDIISALRALLANKPSQLDPISELEHIEKMIDIGQSIVEEEKKNEEKVKVEVEIDTAESRLVKVNVPEWLKRVENEQ